MNKLTNDSIIIRWILIAWSVKQIVLILILKCLKQKNNRLLMKSKYSVCGTKKSRFVKKQDAKGLLSNLGIKTPLSKMLNL